MGKPTLTCSSGGQHPTNSNFRLLFLSSRTSHNMFRPRGKQSRHMTRKPPPPPPTTTKCDTANAGRILPPIRRTAQTSQASSWLKAVWQAASQVSSCDGVPWARTDTDGSSSNDRWYSPRNTHIPTNIYARKAEPPAWLTNTVDDHHYPPQRGCCCVRNDDDTGTDE